MHEQLLQLVHEIIDLLVAGKYSEVEELTNGQWLDAQTIAEAITGYGRQLVSPPAEAFGCITVVEVRGAEPRRWSITMPLWTREEGRSDLSLELTVTVDGPGFAIELDDLHVP